ncbi:MAG: hypothetical protein F6K24_29265 [Okeania sp. SIO2D1]|nr:hypothetical protein [Okeania sp. SIO2D1]
MRFSSLSGFFPVITSPSPSAYLGFAEKVLWVRVGDRRQETGDRRQEKRE